MKKVLLMLLGVLMALPAFARDFKYTYQGQTLTYTVIDESLKTVKTLAGTYSNGNATAGNSVSGVLKLPETVYDENKVAYTLTTIGSNGFPKCLITDIEFPQSLIEIENYAFQDCYKLNDVILPPSFKVMRTGAFQRCNIKVACPTGTYNSSNNTYVTGISYNPQTSIIENGIIIDNHELLFVANTKKTYIIPESVTSIGSSAFSGCNVLTSVSIPTSVTSIGKNAFNGCDGLKDVIYNAKKCTFSDSAKSPFPTTIKTLTFGDSVEMIPYFTAYQCSELYSVTIGKSVTSLGKRAFEGCSSLIYLVYNAKNCQIMDSGGPFPSTIMYLTIGDSVEVIPDFLWYNCKSLTSVTIPDKVTSIGGSAFYGCSGLTKAEFASIEALCKIDFGSASANPLYYAKHLYINGGEITDVIIPETVTSIGNYAFYNCNSLTSVNIPTSVTSIGKSAFQACSSLNSVTIPESVTSVGESAFDGCSGLSSVSVGNSVESIGSSAFYGCSGLTSVTIPNSVTSIGRRAFYNCNGLKDVIYNAKNCTFGDDGESPFPTTIKTLTFGDSVEIIPSYTVYKCAELTTVAIPESVTSIGSSAFSDCNSLKDVIYNAKNCTFGDNNKSPFPTTIKTLTFGDNVAIIPDYIAYRCSDLTSVTIPDQVTSIGSSAFRGCAALTELTIPETVTSIGSYAFYGCSALKDMIYNAKNCTFGDNKKGPFPTTIKTLTFGDNVEVIPSYIAYQCNSLTSVTIPDKVTSIGSSSFYGCSGFTELTIPETVDSIGESAFSGCSGLTDVIYNAKNCTFGDNKKGPFPTTIKTLTFGDNVAIIPGYIAYRCSDLTSVIIPDKVTSIGLSAFYGCSGLTSVTIPDKVTSIGSLSFYGCAALTSVTIPKTVTSIGYAAFDGCLGLKKAEFASIEALCKIDFGNASANPLSNAHHLYIGGSEVTDVVIPETVSSINNYVFHNCNGLTSVIIHDKVVSIGSEAFYNCNGLTSVIIPASVTSIGSDTFWGCSELKKSAYPNTLSNPFPAGICIAYNPEGAIIDNGCVWGQGKTAIYFAPMILEGGFIIPNTVTSIGLSAFHGCSGLTSVTIPDKVTSIGSSSFYGCSSLTELTIPEMVDSIGEAAFSGCSGLTDVVYNAKNCTFGDNKKGPFPTTIKILTFGDNVEVIPSYIAYQCNSLTSVTIPNSVTSIGERAFDGCLCLEKAEFASIEALCKIDFQSATANPLYNAEHLYINGSEVTELVIPETVASIGEYAFWNGTNLTSVSIGNSVKSIGEAAFWNCSGLTSVIIPNSVSSIGENAFRYCNGLKKSAYPNTISNPFPTGSCIAYNPEGTILEDGWIWGPDKTAIYFAPLSLEGEVTIPESVTSIGSRAFYGCNGLTSVVITAAVTSIGSSAFNGCNGLKKSAYPNTLSNPFPVGTCIAYNPEGAIIDNGCVWGQDKTAIYFAPLSLTGEFTIPESVKSIGSSAFSGCSGLTSVISMAETSPVMETNSFEGLYDTAEAIVPDNSLNSYLTSNWALFSNLKTAGGVISAAFSDDVFNFRVNGEKSAMLIAGNYGDMTSISIPERVVFNDKFHYVTYIGDEAFKNCKNITAIVLPKRLEEIGTSAFEGAKISISDLSFPTTLTKIHDNAFNATTGISSVTLPEKVDYIGNSAFAGSSIAMINIPVAPGASCFKNATNLSSVTFAEKVDTIAAEVFYGCTKLENITLPQSLTQIGANAFSGCTGLTSITIPDAVTSIGSKAFFVCNGLTSVTIPSSVQSIGESAFSGCSGLTTLTLPNSVESISESTFCGCSGLTTLTLPNSVESIGESAFSECTGLTSVTVGSSINKIPNTAFSNCNAISTLKFEYSENPIEIGERLTYNVLKLYLGRNLNIIGE